VWGSLASCGRLAIGQAALWRETAAVGNRRAGYQPALLRWQRFHFYVAHPVCTLCGKCLSMRSCWTSRRDVRLHDEHTVEAFPPLSPRSIED